jgi:ABC-type transporter Mla MlaB component
MRTVTFSLDGALARSRLPVVCMNLWMLLAASGSTRALCDVQGVPADLAAVDALARLQLFARQRGLSVGIRGARTGLRELLALTGLEAVL